MKKKLIAFLNIFPPLLLLTFQSVSQTGISTFKFRPFNVDNTFENENIRYVFQDSNGYIWAGMDSEGLCIFNGSKASIFGHVSSDSQSIASNYINFIEEDSNNNIWLATEKGLNVFEKDSYKIHTYWPTFGNRVNVIHKSNNQSMWVGTENGILIFRPDVSTGSSRISGHLLLKNELTNRMRGRSITSLYEDPENVYWIGTDNGLFKYTSSSGKLKKWSKEKDGLSDNEIKSIVRLDKNHLLIGTDNGVNLFNCRTQHFDRLEFRDSGIFNFGKVGIMDIFIDSNKTIWIGTSTYGIITGDSCVKESDQSVIKLKTPSAISGLNSSYITDITEDHHSQVWVATKFGGIFLYDQRGRMFPHFKLDHSGEVSEEEASFIISADEDREGNLWIGTRDRGLIKYVPSTNTYQEIMIFQGASHVRRIESIFCDSENILWVGHKKGLNKLDLKTGAKEYFEFAKVIGVLENSEGQLWVGTHSGLLLLDKTGNKLPYSINNQHILANPDLVITRLLSDNKENNLWIGTDNRGLFKFNYKDDKLQHFFHHPAQPSSLSGNTIRSLLQDSNDRIWIGTKSSGLNLLTENGFHHVRESDGLSSNTIFSLLEDRKNYLWITSNNGLSQFSHLTGECINFSIGHGLQGKVFEKYASVALHDGRFFVAGNNGFNLFHPDSIEIHPYSPPLAINEIRANTKIIARDIFTNNTIRLPYSQNIISFEFSALDYRNIHAIHYKYKLNGVDLDWINAGPKNQVTYSNLPHGKYRFELSASNADGVWNDDIITCEIIIKRPPWLTWWAIMLYGLSVLGFLYLIYWLAKVRANYVHSLQTKELQLKQSEEMNQMKLNFFTNISHELRTPLTLILAPLEKLRKSHHRELIHKSVSLAYKSARQLLHLTDQLMCFRKTEDGNLPLQVRKQDICRFLQNLINPFYQLAENKGITLLLTCSNPPFVTWFDEDKLEKIINNLLVNAFKFTGSGGKITLSCKQIGDKIHIAVKDTGEGISPDKIDHIFDRYYQADSFHIGCGIGLELVKSLTILHHGTISVTSTPHVGSEFEIQLPADRMSYNEKELANQDSNSTLDSIVKDTYILPEDAHYLKNPLKPSSTSFRILVVEDNYDLRSYLTEYLQPPFNIITANNGQEALDFFQTNSVDLVITDVLMPKVNGLELCEMLKNDIKTSHIPVVLLTARDQEDHQIAGFETGADAYILKPFNVEILKARLLALLKNRKRMVESIKEHQVFEPEKIASNKLDENLMQRINEIMESNYSNPAFSISEFAQDLHLSRSQLFRKVKSITGQTPSEYLYAFRIKKAVDLLEGSDLNISQIAYQTGFSTPNSFSKTFAKHMGVSPSKYIARTPDNL